MEGRQRIGVLVHVPELLRELGQDPIEVLATAGLTPDRLLRPDESLTFVEADKLLTACVDATHCQHFGLLVGQRSTTDSPGLVGQLMRTAPTLKDAILDLCTNQPRFVRGSVIYLIVEHDVAFWGYAVYQPGRQSIDQIGEAAIAAGFCFLQEFGRCRFRRSPARSPNSQRHGTLCPPLRLDAPVHQRSAL